MKDKGLIFVSVLFIVMTLADIISTALIGKELLVYLETNALYKYVGLIGIFLVNVGVIIWFIYWYKKTTKPFYRFIILNFFLTVSVLRVFIAINNYRIAMNPPAVETLVHVSQAVKTQAMAQFLAPFFIPYIIAMFTFMFFQWDHKIGVGE